MQPLPTTKARATQRLPAAVLHDGEPGAESAARVVPARAKIVRVGLEPGKGAIVGYYSKPKRRSGRRPPLAELRMRELESLIRARVGGPLGGEAAALVLRIVAGHLPEGEALNWAATWCPEISPAEAIGIVSDGAGRRWRAGELGDALGLQVGERDALGLKTIRPARMSGLEFRTWARARKRERDRDRAALRRRAAGAQARRKGDAAAEEAARQGVSRRTILRRKKAEKEGVSPENRKYLYPYKFARDFRVPRHEWTPAGRALLTRAAAALRRPVRVAA